MVTVVFSSYKLIPGLAYCFVSVSLASYLGGFRMGKGRGHIELLLAAILVLVFVHLDI